MKILESLQWTALFLTAALTTAFASLACVTSPCVYGICMETLNGSSYTCYCIDGYTGTNCQTNWDECWSSPCLNGGTCLDGVAYFNCTCPDGFVGDTCEENVDECGSNPCLNNGTCLDIANGYTCQCQPGYSGFNCEVDMAVCNTTEETRCANGGACLEGPGISFSCRCLPGWTGKLCEAPVDECSSSPCENGGVCIDMHATYVCACPYGYTGINCETQVELCSINTCENNALCVIEGRQSVCYCVPDYHGERCQFRYDECLKGPGCLNGGNCIDGVDSYTCSCPPRLTGRFCECLVTETGKLNCNYIRPEVPNITTTTETSRYYPSTSISLFTTYATKENGDLYTSEAITEVPIDYTTIEQISRSTITEGRPSITEITAQTYTISPATGITESYTRQVTTETGPFTTSISTEGTEISTVKEEQTPEYGSTDGRSEMTEISTAYWMSTTEFSEKHSIKTEIDITTSSFEKSTEPSTMYIASKELTTYEYLHTPSSPPATFPSLTQITEEWQPKTTASIDGTGSTELITFGTPTDMYGSSSSTELIPDCQKQPCENGGSCINTTQGAKCHCKFGWIGKFCEKEEGIKVAAFKGRSYLLHVFGNSSTISISLKMRTLAENGIILYAHASANIYMSLYLQQGFLKFQFSCGIQTMLFSELKYSINTGFLMGITATLELLPQNGLLKKCNGSVKLNGTLSMSGKQETLNPTVGMKMSGVLYLGGLSPQVAHQVDIPYKEGITACMHDLRVNEISRKIYGDAFDGVDVNECESLACLSSPCQNSATCIEIGQKWNCLCPSGFLGKMCERSVCLNNPCKYGGTCVIYPGSGFICLCPLGKHGMYCDQDLEIGHPHFSSSVSGLSSYTAYPLPGAIHHSFELHFRFVPSSLDQIALMIFIGQSHPHDSSSDHLAVSFIKGYVVLTWNLGSGPRRIFTPQAIIDSGQGKQTHNVRLGRSGQIGWLQVDSMPNVTGTSPGWLSQLNTRPIIYVGGHESRNFSGLPHDLPLHSGYSGCLYDLELRAGKVRLSIQRSRDAVGRNVGQCSTRHCHNSTCLHRGACIDHGATFTCLCQDGWFGAGCEIRYNPCDSSRNNCSQGSTCVPLPMGYECDCPLGKTGRYCQLDETLSDVGFSGHRSFLSLAPASLELTETCIDLEIRPVLSRGLILYSSQTHALSTMFISLSLHGGVLEFRIQPIGGQRRNGDVLVVRSGRVLSLGQWARVRAGRYGRRIFLWVEGSVNSGTLLPGEILLPSHSPLYIGGVPDLSELPSGAVAGLPVPFSGCVRRLWLNWRSVTLNEQNIIAARNINDCDGTACGGDICFNGGSCWLTADNRPICNCPQQYIGERCEQQVSCVEVGCENNGRCIKHNKQVRCSCPTGWTGPFCNLEVPTGAPHFGGDSFLVVDSQHILTKRGGGELKDFINIDKQMNDYVITYLYLNFSTAQHDGMILWTSQNNEFLGLGIETGFMKIVWGMHGIIKKEILLPGLLVADGTWHTLTMTTTDKGTVFLTDRTIAHTYTSNASIHTDGIFYLGGFPEDRKVSDETSGYFQKPFSGCIKEIAWNEQFTVLDFSKFTGENVGSCDLIYP